MIRYFQIFLTASGIFLIGGLFTINFGPTNTAVPPRVKTTAAKPPPTEPVLIVSSEKPEQGDILVLMLSGESDPKKITASIGSSYIHFFKSNNTSIAIIGIDTKSETGTSTISIKLSSGVKIDRSIFIKERGFPVTKLVLPTTLAKQGVTPKVLVKKIETNDQPKLDDIFKTFTPEIYFSSPFMEPLPEWVDVGGFGITRKSGNTSVRHLGTDLLANLGDEVYASNDGMVRLSDQLENFGKTVVLDHGLGIFSAYLHLSEIKAAQGKHVKKSEIIGLVGSTGEYSLEPHLHFSVKVNGISVDPARFIKTVNQFLE